MGEIGTLYNKKPDAKKDNSAQIRKAEFSKPVISPADRILFLQRTIGNQAVQRLIRSGALRSASHSNSIQMKAGVESFDVNWDVSDEATPTDEKFDIDFSAKFKDDDEHDPDDAEFRQNAGDKLVIKDGPHKGDGDYEGEVPLQDDGYSRLADPGDYSGADFESDDIPGIDDLDPADDIDYEFSAEQMIIDTSDSNKIIAQKNLHTVTIKGKAPRVYSGLPHNS